MVLEMPHQSLPDRRRAHRYWGFAATRHPCPRRVRSSRSRFERGFTLDSVAGHPSRHSRFRQRELAATAWARPSRTTDKMTNRRFDIHPHQPNPPCTCPELTHPLRHHQKPSGRRTVVPGGFHGRRESRGPQLRRMRSREARRGEVCPTAPPVLQSTALEIGGFASWIWYALLVV